MIRPHLIFLGLSLFAQQKPFTATARIGVPVIIGHETFMDAKTKIETATLREVTLESAELAQSFPNRHEVAAAGPNEKLLILRGIIRNPEKTTDSLVNPGSGVGLRLWERYTGTGKFAYVHIYDPQTLDSLRKKLMPGESTPFISVWRIPADLTDFRFGLTYARGVKVAWYDLGPLLGKLPAAFAPPDGFSGKTFATIAEPAGFTGDARDPAKRSYVVAANMSNR